MKKELERISCRLTFALGGNIGPEFDIPAPDMNTNSQIMAWILDTCISTVPPHDQSQVHLQRSQADDIEGAREL